MTNLKPQDCKTMQDIRGEIDRLDRALVDLIAERFSYIHRAWQIKLSENSAALVPWRVQEVVDKVRAQASARNVPPDMIEALWRQMMGWFIQYEDEKLRKEMEQKS